MRSAAVAETAAAAPSSPPPHPLLVNLVAIFFYAVRRGRTHARKERQDNEASFWSHFIIITKVRRGGAAADGTTRCARFCIAVLIIIIYAKMCVCVWCVFKDTISSNNYYSRCSIENSKKRGRRTVSGLSNVRGAVRRFYIGGGGRAAACSQQIIYAQSIYVQCDKFGGAERVHGGGTAKVLLIIQSNLSRFEFCRYTRRVRRSRVYAHNRYNNNVIKMVVCFWSAAAGGRRQIWCWCGEFSHAVRIKHITHPTPNNI